MGSESIKLPVIDFTNFEQERESVKRQVMESLEEYGCFEAIFGQIPLHLRKSLFHDALRQLFDLPIENKMRNVLDKPYHGYSGKDAMFPLSESMTIDDVLSQGIEAFADLMWSEEGNPTFSKCVRPIGEKMIELDNIVRTMVVESLGLQKYMDEHLGSSKYYLRVNKYDPPNQTDTINEGLFSHVDLGIITILYQDDVNGLELLTKDGQWFTIEPSPGSFLVMSGVTLQAWTNGRLNAPYHRVMMTGDKERYSILTFSIPKADCIVKAPVEMVDEEHPLLFKPFEHVKFVEYFNSKFSLDSKITLNDYCGV